MSIDYADATSAFEHYVTAYERPFVLLDCFDPLWAAAGWITIRPYDHLT